jgi:hypothetical protein
MGNVIFLSFVSVLNPTLVAVSTVMLLLPNPGRLMLGYWLGAMITSVTVGLLIVFSLEARAPSAQPRRRSARSPTSFWEVSCSSSR